MRLRTPDGYKPSGDVVLYGRKILGELLDHAKATGLSVAKRSVTLVDGTQITALFDGTTPVLTIAPPETETTSSDIDLTAVWVPRGFVLRTATNAFPTGAGLPAVLDGDNPEARANLTPGAAIGRWTGDGPCGEVLLARDTNAAEPPEQLMLAPLLYSDRAGPIGRVSKNYDVREPQSGWAAYRLSFARWTSFYEDEVPASKRATWQLVNAHRADLGLAAMYLWPRAYCLSGQLTANILAANGNNGDTSTAYPIPFRSAADRLSKDGYPESATDLTASDRATVYGAFELRSNTSSPSSALATWLADPASKAVLERDSTAALFLDVGSRGGHLTAAVVERSAWIAAGNCSWQPGDGRCAPLSWRGFRSLNYGFETLPTNLNGDTTYPLSVAQQFATSSGVWFSYYLSSQRSERALDQYVYLRGRAIAQAPDGGLIWAAGAMDLTTADRLIVLTHHVADQPAVSTPDSLAYGMTRYLRVWWCDVPKRAMVLDPDRVICGTDAADAYAWKGGQLVDVSAMPSAPELPLAAPNALKYASAWRFAPDGSRAVCLRDYGRLANYATFNDATTATVAYGLFPRTLELVFTATATDLTAAVQWGDMTAGWTTDARAATSLPQVTLPAGFSLSEGSVTPIAVDYDINGQLLYAFKSDCSATGTADIVKLTYVGTGRADTAYASQMGNLALVSSDLALSTMDTRFTGYLQCLDVRNGVFVADGTRPRLQMNYATGLGELNPAFQPCRTFVADLVHNVKAWRAGTKLVDSWFPCPDGAVFQQLDLCDASTTGTPTHWIITLSKLMSQNVQGSYAEKFGDWLLSVLVSPQPNVVVAMPSGYPVTAGHCGCQTSIQDYAAYGAFVTAAETLPRGGSWKASFDVPAEAVQGAWLQDVKTV